ncbi:MAG: YcfA family protein, partial [Verrucomicrobiaceae bacterium]|nr:YcfA family protein [Verrucomicrobiaceae bacterium]
RQSLDTNRLQTWMELERVKGSHHIMSKDGEEDILVIPVHANRPLKTGTLRALMKTAGITEADL